MRSRGGQVSKLSMIPETNEFGDEANRRLVECKLDASYWSRTQLKSETSLIVTRRCDAAALNASEFFLVPRDQMSL